MVKNIDNLKKGDIVRYTDLFGVTRDIKFLGCFGLVKCIKGEPESPAYVFEFEGKTYQIPLIAWKFTGVKYEIL